MLKHDHIDILKIDIEGWEWSVLETLLKQGQIEKFKKITQIVIEVHFWNNMDKNAMDVLNGLNDLGYEIFHLHQNSTHGFVFEIGFKRRI